LQHTIKTVYIQFVTVFDLPLKMVSPGCIAILLLLSTAMGNHAANPRFDSLRGSDNNNNHNNNNNNDNNNINPVPEELRHAGVFTQIVKRIQKGLGVGAKNRGDNFSWAVHSRFNPVEGSGPVPEELRNAEVFTQIVRRIQSSLGAGKKNQESGRRNSDNDDNLWTAMADNWRFNYVEKSADPVPAELQHVDVFTQIVKRIQKALGTGSAIEYVEKVENDDDQDDGVKYAVIVDAGSSGSRIYVYEYTKEHKLKRVTDHNGKPWSHRVEPGISSLAGKTELVRDYIFNLIQAIFEEVPDSSFPRAKWDKTPFLWFATAGMRLLPAEQADEITLEIRRVASDKSVIPFKFQKEWARTISGEEEGAFAWISANYQNGFFDKDSNVEDFGVVETGGASMQMTFRPTGDIRSNKFSVLINGVVYPLYTYSFLHFGVNEITKRVLSNECLCVHSTDPNCKPCIDNHGRTFLPVKSPCLLKDDRRTSKVKYLNREYVVPFIGTGNGAECRERIEPLFRADYTCFTKPCSFAGIYQPAFKTDKRFYATAASYYTMRDLGLLTTNSEVTWPAVKEAAEDYCKQDVTALAPLADKWAWTRCLQGTYVAKQLENLKFAKEHEIVAKDFGTWTIGATLYQLELMNILFHVTS